jgi:hypothetical protein
LAEHGQEEGVARKSAEPTGDREVRSTMQKAVVHKVVRDGAGGGGVSDTIAAPTSSGWWAFAVNGGLAPGAGRGATKVW